ncbi:hypothetical protein B0H14DRAFT_2606897 [Mycena olivaceomarginata]|nr:hypothetical protein B0H14DRAFT_2606897 [Mycena olivaceomarginata]
MLEGGGGWRNLDFMTPSLLGKRARSPDVGSDDTADMEETHCTLFPSFEAQDSEDEEEVEGYAQDLLRRADVFQKAAEILRAQKHRMRCTNSPLKHGIRPGRRRGTRRVNTGHRIQWVTKLVSEFFESFPDTIKLSSRVSKIYE